MSGGYSVHKSLEFKEYTIGSSYAADSLGSDLRRFIAQNGEALVDAFNKVSDGAESIPYAALGQVLREVDPDLRFEKIELIRTRIQEMLPFLGNTTAIQEFTVRMSTDNGKELNLVAFKEFLKSQQFDIPVRTQAEPGSRIPGYSGHRSLVVAEASVGASAAKLVSGAVRQRVAGRGTDFERVFAEMDTNSDGIVCYDELLFGLKKMDAEINDEQIRAIYDEMRWKASDGQVRIAEFLQWMNQIKPQRKTMGADIPCLPPPKNSAVKRTTISGGLAYSAIPTTRYTK